MQPGGTFGRRNRRGRGARAWDRVLLSVKWWSGDLPSPGDGLETSTGRRYLVFSVKRRRKPSPGECEIRALECVVLPEGEKIEGRVFEVGVGAQTMIFHVASMSGGKDSVPATLVAREEVGAENLVMAFADTGNEEQTTYDYVFDYLPGKLELPLKVVRADFAEEFTRKRANLARLAAGEPESAVYGKREFDYHWTPEAAAKALELLHPTGNPYLDLCMVRGGFPSRKRQFCTEYLKRNPIVEYQEALIAEHGAVWSWQGVRADESASRKGLRCTAGGPACDKGFEVVGGGLFIRRPIIRWKAEDCFETMRYFGVKPNPLYTQGFSRVGCFPCINASKSEISQIARRYPEHVDRIAKWEELVSSVTRPGSKATFFHVRTIGGQVKEATDDEAGVEVDESKVVVASKHDMRAVVQWARTTRGGRQFNLLEEAEEPTSCSSAYGLCE